MRDVTIFGNFTVLQTFMLNGMQVDEGFDERLDIFCRVNFGIEKGEDDTNDTFIECYYRSIPDLKKEINCYSIKQY